VASIEDTTTSWGNNGLGQQRAGDEHGLAGGQHIIAAANDCDRTLEQSSSVDCDAILDSWPAVSTALFNSAHNHAVS
jgi:hypothetical protein